MIMMVVTTMQFFHEERGCSLLTFLVCWKCQVKVCHLELQLTKEVFGRAQWGGTRHLTSMDSFGSLPVCFLCRYPLVVSSVRFGFLWGWPSSREAWHSLIKGLQRALPIHQSPQTMLCCFVPLHFSFWISSLLATLVHYLPFKGQTEQGRGRENHL